MADATSYSGKYKDDCFEYRHVTVSKRFLKRGLGTRLLVELEWRSLGITQSKGWVHFFIHTPEPYILPFRRPLGTNPITGKAPTTWVPPPGLLSNEITMWLSPRSQDIYRAQELKRKQVKGSATSVAM